MKQKIIEVTTFIVFLVPLLVILASPTFSSQALGLDQPIVRSVAAPNTQTFYAMGGLYDGWILESGEFTGVGGSINTASTTIPVGDAVQDRQYRGVITFATDSLPSPVYVQSATLYLTGAGGVGINPFNFGDMRVDIKQGFFGTRAYLEPVDFQASASPTLAGNKLTCGAIGVCPIALYQTSYNYINPVGFTQFRLRFVPDDNDNLTGDYYRLFSGDTATLANRPRLVVSYYP